MVLSPVSFPDAPVENVLARLKGVRKSLHGWVACCPAHRDREPSLSIGLGDEGQVLLICFAGCSLDSIVKAMGITVADLFPTAAAASESQPEQTQRNVLTLVDLASDKLLHWKYLLHLGVTEQRTGCLQIPYHLPDGTPAPRHRLRTALVAKEGSHWSKGSGEIVPYGLERLEEARKAGYLVLVEGESDCWTLWFHHFPALGLPGVEMVRTLKEAYLAGIDKLYIVREPDAAGERFVQLIQEQLQAWKWPGKAYMVSLGDAKDPNELHKKNWKDFKAAFQQALDSAQPLVGAHAQLAPSTYEYVPTPFTLKELLAKQLPPVQWAIPDILPEGLTLLAGKPKLGKSWLALAMALAVASGGVALGTYPVTQGEVLYLALEDNERRLQSRAQQLLASMTTVPTSISFELRWPRLDQGGLTYVEEYLQTHPDVRLVVIDTWARVSPKVQHRQRSQYEDEYAALTPLKHLADTYRVSILAIHHLRKMRGDDVLDEITGSIGLTGAVDGALILKRERGQHDASLFVTGRDIEHEQQLALRFDAQTAMWMLVGNAEEVRRTKERQDILDLLSEQFPEGMTPRQVADALDKNYHTTRCLLRKMEMDGSIQHNDSRYVAIPAENSRNQSDYSHQCNHRNHRNQSVPLTLQHDDQVARGVKSCLSATDYVDYTDYAHERISANVFQTHSIPSPFGGCSLHFPSVSEDVLSQREDMQDAQDDRNGSVINLNHRNQSMSVKTQTSDHVGQSSANIDYGDYIDYANDIDYDDGVISRNHRNQSISATTQVSDDIGQSSPLSTDYGDDIDYSDYADYANESVSAYWSQTYEPDPSSAGSSIQYLLETVDLLTKKEDIQGTQDHRVDYDDGIINRNQRNQSDLQHSQATLWVEQRESNTALHTNGAFAAKARASPSASNKKRCPHHPHTRWIRFDPSGQAWCDKMDCWDCYRLMKIGEALDYQSLSKYTRGIVTLEQGIEAWSSFVTSQGSFAVLTATQYAIDLCKALGIEVPNLSGEVKRLVSVRE
jgi:AAA domain